MIVGPLENCLDAALSDAWLPIGRKTPEVRIESAASAVSSAEQNAGCIACG